MSEPFNTFFTLLGSSSLPYWAAGVGLLYRIFRTIVVPFKVAPYELREK